MSNVFSDSASMIFIKVLIYKYSAILAIHPNHACQHYAPK